jgi:hypothetical protein
VLSVAPLTGIESTEPVRPALLVKIDDVDAARPQDGLFAADVIFEELVEGGLTRLGAVYSSTDPDLVGPIRSVRETDLHLAALLGRPALVFSGGAVPVLDQVHQAREAGQLVPVAAPDHPDIFFRDPGRPIPHNLYARASDLWDVAVDAAPPTSLFRFGAAAPGLPASAFAVSFPSTRVAYRWDAGSRLWLRSQNAVDQVDAARPDEVFGVDNVVVMRVEYRPSSTNELSPELQLGGGTAWVYRGGAASLCQWSIAPTAPRIELRTETGAACALTPGRTLVELATADPTPS